MPNWCSNTLVVTGNKSTISKFKKLVKNEDTDLSFEKIISTPEDTFIHDPLYPALPNWYNWRLLHWGTKWDVEAIIINEGTTPLKDAYTVEYSFGSAWTPPLIVIEKISKRYKSLLFDLAYDEPGMDFSGITTFKAGNILNEVNRDYSLMAREWEEEEEEETT